MITIKRIFFTGIIGLVAGVALSAAAQSTPMNEQGAASFEEFDRDGDGYVTQGEFDAVRAERQEARGGQGAGRAPAFGAFDSDGDGRLTPEELAVGREALRGAYGQGRGAGHRNQGAVFGDFDLDGDGSITPEELEQGRAARIAERASAGYPMRNLANRPSFEELDADGNGSISREEMEAFQQRRRTERQGQPQ
jgi:Ca2+-binding EF-hand superfamily protein